MKIINDNNNNNNENPASSKNHYSGYVQQSILMFM